MKGLENQITSWSFSLLYLGNAYVKISSLYYICECYMSHFAQITKENPIFSLPPQVSGHAGEYNISMFRY